MTAYELADLGQSLYANSLTTYAIFLTLVSGYLVVSYTIGKSLELAPLVVINILYLITTANTIAVMYEANALGHYLSEKAAVKIGINLNTESYNGMLISIVDVSVVLASLYFMWLMRRKYRIEQQQARKKMPKQSK